MSTDLKRIRMFSGLEDAELGAMTAYLETQEVDPGQVIVEEGVAVERCYFIARGCVRVSSSMGRVDQEEVFSLLREGDHFGEMSLIDGHAPAASVFAEERCLFYTISHDDLRRLISSEPDLANRILWSMLKTFCTRLRETNLSLSFARFLMKRPDADR